MKKKGFTLIELLAVIVILAVLSIITISVTTKLVHSAKLKSFQTKIYALESAAETYFEEEILDGDESVFKKGIDGTNSLTIHLNNKSEVKKLDIQGKTFNKGFVTITDEGKVSITAIEDNLCGQKLHSSSVINMLDIKEDFTCYLLNTTTGETNIGTQDVLTAIQNLSNDIKELKKENDDLKSSNQELKDAINNLNNNAVGTEIALNKIYPVGSIYISTTLKTKEEVKESLGGEWEVYGDGKVLRSSTEESGQTNDSTGNISLTVANLPSHSHSYTPSGTITSTFKGTAVNTNSVGAHTHNLAAYGENFVVPSGLGSGLTFPQNSSGTTNGGHWFTGSYYAASAGAHKHSVTAAGTVTSTFTGTKSNTESTGSNTAFSVLDPYITVYMYKRVK